MKSEARDLRTAASSLLVICFIAVAGSLYFLRPVLVPFVLALFLASGLRPALAYLERVTESRVLALGVALVVSFFVTSMLWWVIGFSVAELQQKQQQYFDRLSEVIDRTAEKFLVFVDADDNANQDAGDSDNPPDENNEIEEGGAEPAEVDEDDGEVADSGPPPPSTSARVLDLLAAQLKADSRSIIETVSGELYGLITNGVLVMIFLFFLLLGSPIDVPDDNLWSEVDVHVRNYIVTKSIISLFTGLAFAISLWMFGVPMAAVFGLLAFLLNFIPNIGPVIATLLPIPLLVLDPNFTTINAETGETVWRWGWAMAALSVSGFVQFASGNLIEPRILGGQFKLHPIAILLSLIFWSIIWGMPGAFLAVPITSALKIMLNESERTRPVAHLLEGNLAMFSRPTHTSVA